MMRVLFLIPAKVGVSTLSEVYIDNMLRVLFLIPVRVSKSYEYRVLAQCDVGIFFNTRERVGQMHVVVGLDIMWVLILISV